MITADLLALSKQLYPTGRAFWCPEGGDMEGLHKATNISYEQGYNDLLTLFSGLLPDNPNFVESDAVNWERVFGLTPSSTVTLDDRKAAIYQKLAYPGGQPARQNYLFIQGELQQAGFDVYVYENIFSDGMGGYTTKTPFEVSGDSSIFTTVRYGQVQYGQSRYGVVYNNKIANSINEADDLHFDIGGDYTGTFFVGGATLGTYANVPLARHDEFRQLLLRLKPTHNVGFLFITYTT